MPLEKPQLPRFQDPEKQFTPASASLEPASLGYRRKLVLIIAIQVFLTVYFVANIDVLDSINVYAGPVLLGATTASLAQALTQYTKKKFVMNKIFKFVLWGSLNGIMTYVWLGKVFLVVDNLFLRVLLDQLIGLPSFQFVFNVINSLWEHGEIFHVSARLAYFKSIKVGYCFWPLFSLTSFAFLPPSLLFQANIAANLFWNIILSKFSL